jgi:hypothetical protein
VAPTTSPANFALIDNDLPPLARPDDRDMRDIPHTNNIGGGILVRNSLRLS